MVSWWRKTLSSFAVASSLASQLILTAPSASAAPPLEKIVKEQNVDELKVNEQEVSEEKPVPIYVNWNLFYLNPAAIPVPKGSILSVMNLDELPVHALGLSADCFTWSKDFGRSWQGTLPFGIFTDLSSTSLLQASLQDKGTIKYKELDTRYKIRGDISYFAIGLTLNPAVFYQSKSFSIGLAIDFKGGLTFLASENQIGFGLTDKTVRGAAESQGVSPDAAGSVKIYGFGGFGQVLIGPIISLEDVVCSGGAGFRYDLLTLRVQEKIDNNSLMKDLPGNYDTKYHQSSLLFGAKCGYRF